MISTPPAATASTAPAAAPPAVPEAAAWVATAATVHAGAPPAVPEAAPAPATVITAPKGYGATGQQIGVEVESSATSSANMMHGPIYRQIWGLWND